MQTGEDVESQTFEIYQGKSDLNGFINPRLGFVRKVYGILSVQLLITTVFVILAQTSMKSFFQPAPMTGNPLAISLFYLASVFSIITCIMIGCYTSLARSVPTNYILLGVFTLCEAYLVAFTTTFFYPQDVLLAAALTCALTFTLTLYAYTTKKDFTIYGATLWILSWGLFALTLLLSLIFFSNSQAFRVLDIVVSVVCVVFYGFYLIYDTQIIMGGGKFELSLDDYVIGALVIYVDIIILFLRILRIIAAMRSRN